MKRKTPKSSQRSAKPKSSSSVIKRTDKPQARATRIGGKIDTNAVFQLKITLRDSRPPIWRRIEFRDCTLDKLHEYIQTAMGWTNSHLHHFEIEGRLHGDPFLMSDNFGELEYKDSTRTKLSKIVPKSAKKHSFDYEYDFGDSWHHQVVVEACTPAQSGVKYPRCVAGANACPPEDVGGVWGYADFVKIMANPKHKDHEEMSDWVGGKFDPEEFDPAAATKRMQKGLPGL